MPTLLEKSLSRLELPAVADSLRDPPGVWLQLLALVQVALPCGSLVPLALHDEVLRPLPLRPADDVQGELDAQQQLPVLVQRVEAVRLRDGRPRPNELRVVPGIGTNKSDDDGTQHAWPFESQAT